MSIQSKLEAIRSAIRAAAPEATEAIKYGIPTFVYEGNLVHFGGFKRHVGFYPGGPAAIEAFRVALSPYKQTKEPVPLDLVRSIVEYRVAANAEAALSKRGRPKKPEVSA